MIAYYKPVRHGKWIRDEFGSRCGHCGSYAYRDKFDRPLESQYCPNCGAMMYEDRREEVDELKKKLSYCCSDYNSKRLEADRYEEERKMSDCTNRDEVEVLREELRNCKDYIAELETRCRDLSEELRKTNSAVDDEALKKELSYRGGMIAGLKYAIRCNGVSGGEVDQ